jgi:hypothetical protein
LSDDTALADLLAQKFISRRDVKAIQMPDGAWRPHTADGRTDGQRLPWKRTDLRRHLAGEVTYGHYLLGTDDTCKLFAFDIDLEKNNPNNDPDFIGSWVDTSGQVHAFDAREAWLDRRHPSREFQKIHLMMMGYALASTIATELELPTAMAYSGGKGIHVYGFTGPMPAKDVRDGARIVLDQFQHELEPTKGENFYRTTNRHDDLTDGLRNMTIEVFPKQDSLGGKDLGNLMRLPLGKNLKNPKDPTFFIDPDGDWTKMPPIDPMTALNRTWLPSAVAQNA